MNTKLEKSYGFLEKRQISRYNVNIAVFMFQKEAKKQKNVPRGTLAGYKKGKNKNGKQKNEHRLQEGEGLNSV